MRRLAATIAWRLPGAKGAMLDARVVELVALAALHGSLAAAARAAGMPYRTAWALVAQAEKALGQRLLVFERGVGAALAPLGERLLAARGEAKRLVEARRESLDVPLARVHAAGARPGLVVAASHDLVLAELRDAWLRRHGIAIAFHGSEDAIALYLDERADLAGFHFSLAAGGESVATTDPLLARLDPARDAVLPFVLRTQGLILPRGNPAQVRTLADVAARRLRFVNRQPGSGTRLALERLLKRERVAPEAIVGWTREEFTHAAVAATVAAGEADVGFGIRAAAAQLGLAFVPLADERYAFACRRRDLRDPRIRTFRRLIASPTVAKVVAPLPGYRLVADATARAPVSRG
ncbi:MAG: substrate-binding domain-containing protein [Betaproteobacteria bacterium]